MAADHDRPLSPHLQIYKLPLNAVLSISHRITGLVLALGGVLVVAMLVAAASGSQAYQDLYGIATHWAGQIILFGFTFALYFHLCAGIRHLFWDAGYGYELETATRASWAVLAVAFALSILTWLLALGVGGG